jgi:hypothetical protein
MVEQIAWIALFAVIAGLSVPIVILLLARFGRFEPVSFVAFGREWRFAPSINVAHSSTTGTFSGSPRQMVFAGAVTATAVIFVGPQSRSFDALVKTSSGASSYEIAVKAV